LTKTHIASQEPLDQYRKAYGDLLQEKLKPPTEMSKFAKERVLKEILDSEAVKEYRKIKASQI
jgi:hypothetical protein